MHLSKPPKKIVIVQTAFIGDVVFLSPLVHAIKKSFEETQISVLVRPYASQVAKCIPGVDKVLTFDKHGEESGPPGILKAARRIRKEKFDLLIAPHRSTRTAILSGLTRIPLRVGFRQGLGRLVYHVAVDPIPNESCNLIQNFNLLEKIGIPADDSRLRLKSPADNRAYVEKFFTTNGLQADDKLVALCVGAFWQTKRWPAVYFASLGESLKERGYQPIMFGGPNERELALKINKTIKTPLKSCVGNSLAETAILLSRCEAAIGGDSGLTHMARALGLATVLIYGPTDQKAHIFNEKSKVLTAKVKCRPCSHHGPRKCPDKHHDCMRMVSPENVLDALRKIANLQTPIPLAERQTSGKRADATPMPV
ncbi:MAG: lipopolysaccharide heptosyltransferase II [Deltaproteobacteria bacterium]|nr:lipopolysaccharide heptosyltransferase II [Deltaproteobacteria bacterium]